MKRDRALLITLEALGDGQCGERLAPHVAGFLRDYIARGFRVIVVTDRLEFRGRRYSECELLETIRGLERARLPITEIVVLRNGYDPGPLWDVARRFDLSLHNSTMVSLNGEYVAAARTAGVNRAAGPEVLGAAA